MQKTLCLIIPISFIVTNANSQVTKGNWMLGGSASFRSAKYEVPSGVSTRQTTAELSGHIGYFLINKFVTGLKPGYSRTETDRPHNVTNNYDIGPFVRYYFLPSEKYVNIFSELSYQYGIIKTLQGVSQNSNNFSGELGCAAFFNTSVAIEFTLGYSWYLYNNNSGKVNSIIAGVGFHFHLETE